VWKTVFGLFLVSLLLLSGSCAPKAVRVPSYGGRSFTEVLSDMNRIARISAKFSLDYEKDDRHGGGDGALDISDGGNLSLRLYSLGFLAMEVSAQDGIVRSSPHLDPDRAMLLTRGLRDSLFWWDIHDFSLLEDDDYYYLSTPLRKLWVGRKTFLPAKQEIFLPEGELVVTYEEPEESGGVWYQSKMRLEYGQYSAKIAIRQITFSAEAGGI
jgi:hypothetical protein